MKLVFKTSLVFILVGLTFAGLEAKGKKEFTKTIKKSFETTKNGSVSVSNKYGNVDVKPWNENRVKIDVRIVVNAVSESAAQAVFDRININFNNSPSSVTAETVIESSKGNWWNWGDSKSEYKINYEVFLPADNSLKVSNKYGDVSVEKLNGRADLVVKYGNFRVDELGEDSQISLGYGNGTIVKGRDFDVDIKYSKLRFKDVKDVEIVSKYSTLNFEKAGDIRSTSKYDNYNIGTVREFRNTGKYDDLDIEYADNIIINARYTEAYIERVSTSVDVDFEYGGVSVDKLAKGFSDVNLTGKHTDFKINLESGAKYRMEATADYASIRYPRQMTVTKENEKGTFHEVEGHSGGQSAPGTIKARLNYGGLRVREE